MLVHWPVVIWSFVVGLTCSLSKLALWVSCLRVQPWCAAIHAGQVLGVPSGRAELDWPPASRLLLLLLFLIPQVRSTLSVIGCLCRLLYLPRCAIYHLPLGLAPDFGSSLLPEVMSDSDSCPLHAPPCWDGPPHLDLQSWFSPILPSSYLRLPGTSILQDFVFPWKLSCSTVPTILFNPQNMLLK